MKDDSDAHQDLFNNYKNLEMSKKYTLNEIVGILGSEFSMIEFDKKEVSDLKRDEFVNFKQIQHCMYTEDREVLKKLCIVNDNEIKVPKKGLYKNEKEFTRAMMYFKIQKGERINIILEGKNNCMTNYTVQGESEYIYNLLDILRGVERV